MVTWSPPIETEIRVRGYIISWGLGIPDVNTHVVDENSRYYKIAGLESNSEYVISLRARNLMGDGPPRYDYIRTRDDEPVETALEVPVGLRGKIKSSFLQFDSIAFILILICFCSDYHVRQFNCRVLDGHNAKPKPKGHR